MASSAARRHMSTLLRPKVVSDYQAARVSQERLKWKAYTVLTWVVTLGAGFFMSMQEHSGVPGSGDHALRNYQRWVRQTWEDVVLGASGSKPTAPVAQSQTASETVRAPEESGGDAKRLA